MEWDNADIPAPQPTGVDLAVIKVSAKLSQVIRNARDLRRYEDALANGGKTTKAMRDLADGRPDAAWWSAAAWCLLDLLHCLQAEVPPGPALVLLASGAPMAAAGERAKVLTGEDHFGTAVMDYGAQLARQAEAVQTAHEAAAAEAKRAARAAAGLPGGATVIPLFGS